MSAGKVAAKKPPAASPPKKAATPPPVLSPASEHIAFQFISAPGTQTREETEADASASDAIEEASPYGVIIEDGLPAGEGQVNRTPFMDKLAPAIESAADEVLKPVGREAKDCPYLGFWVNYYRAQSAAHIERAIARHAQPEQKNLEGIEQAILAHVRTTVTAWVEHRAFEVPGEIDPRVADDRVADVPAEGAVAQRMGSDDRGAPAAPGSAAAIRGQLSSGRPLDSPVRTRMERAFGTTFGHVRVHTDRRAASTAHAYQARAFTIGQDVAFGSGEYRPGTTAGDLLLAHELAHTVQQRRAVADRAERRNPVGYGDVSAEQDADRAAIGAVAGDPLHGSVAERIAQSMQTGLRLQRCADFQTTPDLEQRLGLSINISPEPSDGKTYIVGQKIKLSIGQKVPTKSMVMVYHWAGIDSRGNEMRGHGPTIEPQIFWPGTTTIRAEVGISAGDNTIETTTLERKIEAVWAKDRAKERVDAAGPPPEFDKYRSGQEFTLALLSPDNTPLPAQAMFVTSTTPNPAPVNSGSATFALGYPAGQTEPPGRTFHWYAFPMSAADMTDKLGPHARTTVEGRDGYDLGAGRTAELPTSRKGIYVVTCHSFDGTQKAAEASWVQTVLDSAEIEATADLKSLLASVDAKLSQFTKTAQGNPDLIPVTAFHVDATGGIETQLSMFIGKRPDGTVVMINATPGLKLTEHRIEFTGSTTADVLDNFNSHNKYPPGAIRFHVPAGKIAGVDGADRTVNTTGETRLGAIAGVLGFGALVLSIAAIPFTGGASAVGTMLLLGASTVGVAAGAFSLADHLSNEKFSKTSIALDCLQIAASAIDLGFAVKALRSSPALLVANRAVRYAMWTSLGVQGASALLISVDAIEQIARIVDDPGLSRGQKLSALTRLIAMLIVTGALLALSYRSMGEAKARMKQHFGAKGEALKDLDAAALGLIDDKILKNLTAAGKDDLERLAAMIREDPALVTRLGGTKNLLGALKGATTNSARELETRLFNQRLTAAGVKGNGVERINQGLAQAGIDPAASHLLTDDDVKRIVTADAEFAKTRGMRDTDPAKAPTVAGARAQIDGVTGVSSATRDELRAGLAHVHGMPDPAFSADPLAALRTKFPKIPPADLSALSALDRDALLALEAAAEGDIRTVIQRLKQNANSDVQDLLKSFFYKQRKPTRKEGEVYVPPTGVGGKIDAALENIAKVRARGWPFGFGTRADYDTFIAKVKAALTKRGIPAGDVRIHGSALHSATPGDIDVAVLVDDATFTALGKKFGDVAPASAKGALAADLGKGKIASANFFPDVKPPAAAEVANAGTKLDAQISVVKHGSEFDLGPYFK